MKRSIGLWQLAGFGVTALGGVLLHFLYDWSGRSAWVAPISGINESTWEHMKILFWPMFLFAVVQSFFFGERQDFWCIKLRGILLGIGLIPVIYYTYNGAISRSPDWLNISIFFFCAAIAFIYEVRQFRSQSFICKNPRLALLALCVTGAMFVIFTFRTPTLGIFADPTSGTYGI